MKYYKSEIQLILILLFIIACGTTTDQVKTDSSNTSFFPGIDTSKTLKEPTLSNYVVSSKTVKPNIKNGKPFDTLDYDKVIAYDFLGNEEPYYEVIDKHGKFVPVILAQQYLSQEQTDKFLSVLASKSTYGEATAACFNPHFAIVLYKNNLKVNQINICLDCNYLISDVRIPAETHKKIEEGTEHEYALNGFTEKGKKAIIDLCKELNFYYGDRDLKTN